MLVNRVLQNIASIYICQRERNPRRLQEYFIHMSICPYNIKHYNVLLYRLAHTDTVSVLYLFTTAVHAFITYVEYAGRCRSMRLPCH